MGNRRQDRREPRQLRPGRDARGRRFSLRCERLRLLRYGRQRPRMAARRAARRITLRSDGRLVSRSTVHVRADAAGGVQSDVRKRSDRLQAGGAAGGCRDRNAMRLTVLAFVLGSSLTLQTGAPAIQASDQWLTKPVDDRTFNTYLEFFAYDRRLPFDLKVTKVEEDQGIR